MEEYKENILKLINSSSDLQDFLPQGKLPNKEMIGKEQGFLYCLYL